MLPSTPFKLQNLNIVSTGGYEPVPGTTYSKITGHTTIDFDDIPDALWYTMTWIPKRLTKDITLKGIQNHLPACGAQATWGTQQSYFDLVNGLVFLIPGDICVGYISVFDSTGGYAYSEVFEFTVSGVSHFDQTLGSGEFCTTSGGSTTATAPIPVTSPVPTKPGKGRK